MCKSITIDFTKYQEKKDIAKAMVFPVVGCVDVRVEL